MSSLAQTQVHERRERRTQRQRRPRPRPPPPHHFASSSLSRRIPPPPLLPSARSPSSPPPPAPAASPTPHYSRTFSSAGAFPSPIRGGPDAVPARRDRVTDGCDGSSGGRRPGRGVAAAAAAAGVAVRAGLRRARRRRGRPGRYVRVRARELEIHAICGGLLGWTVPAWRPGAVGIGMARRWNWSRAVLGDSVS
jgi:hypothetical protein